MESVSPINRFRFVMANGDSKKFRESTDWETLQFGKSSIVEL